jgi:hypothetical protein
MGEYAEYALQQAICDGIPASFNPGHPMGRYDPTACSICGKVCHSPESVKVHQDAKHGTAWRKGREKYIRTHGLDYWRSRTIADPPLAMLKERST